MTRHTATIAISAGPGYDQQTRSRGTGNTVLLLGCAWPPELPLFARGLATVGARVFGVDSVPESHLPPDARTSLSGYLQVTSLFDEQAAFDAVRRWAGPLRFDRVETLWEPTVLLAARLREAFDAP
ncbi:MAG TPA: hypothetical protein VEU30_12110, partial [Thermoanaerobaculia bacterium]|nr:hypothetical protein [Thermoanaerobaculia bacterium]